MTGWPGQSLRRVKFSDDCSPRLEAGHQAELVTSASSPINMMSAYALAVVVFAQLSFQGSFPLVVASGDIGRSKVALLVFLRVATLVARMEQFSLGRAVWRNIRATMRERSAGA